MSERIASLVGLRPYHANRHPHEFSGGQRQRIGIARALAVDRIHRLRRARLGLDVSIQAQVINLLEDLQSKPASPTCLSHTTSVVRHISTRVA